MKGPPTIYVIDDDPAVRVSLETLLDVRGYECRTFDSALRFLASDLRAMAGCIVTDVRMPDIDGLQLQEELARRSIDLPVIVMTGHGDIPLAVRAMRAGAVDFIEKPFREEVLLESIGQALRPSGTTVRPGAGGAYAGRREKLTAREREVMVLVVAGHTNKEIARALEISPRTVDIHRAHMMEKMEAETLADLVRMALAGN